MSDLKVFRVRGGQATEMPGSSVGVERDLQNLIEANMEAMLGIRFLATEYRTGRHRGRIDSLGLDESGTPVIVEYKRSRDQNVVNQALSYLSWLHDHHHEFESVAREKLGAGTTGAIDWSNPRIVCIAGSFTQHDAVAIEMIGRRIDLVSYRLFDDVLTLQLVASAAGAASPSRGRPSNTPRPSIPSSVKSVQQYLDESPQGLKDLCTDLDEILLSYSDVWKETQLHYIAYRRIKNVATVRVQPRNRVLVGTPLIAKPRAQFRPGHRVGGARHLPVVGPADDVAPDRRGGGQHVLALPLRRRRGEFHPRQPSHAEQALPTSVVGAFDHVQVRTAQDFSVSNTQGTENQRPRPGRS
ncbi:transporter [Streptomyces olivaceus]|uniref:transporter n=1 Tax=Streptomyces olivaceus TaxID=47716 RepID=UPI00363C4FC8